MSRNEILIFFRYFQAYAFFTTPLKDWKEKPGLAFRSPRDQSVKKETQVHQVKLYTCIKAETLGRPVSLVAARRAAWRPATHSGSCFQFLPRLCFWTQRYLIVMGRDSALLHYSPGTVRCGCSKTGKHVSLSSTPMRWPPPFLGFNLWKLASNNSKELH